jgi:hypothetical protein
MLMKWLEFEDVEGDGLKIIPLPAKGSGRS